MMSMGLQMWIRCRRLSLSKMIAKDVVVNVVRSVDDVDVYGSREIVTILPTAPNCWVCRSERRSAEDGNEWQAMNERVDTKIKLKTFIVSETNSRLAQFEDKRRSV